MGGRGGAISAEPEQISGMYVDCWLRTFTQGLERNGLMRGILGLVVTVVVIVIVLRFMGVL